MSKYITHYEWINDEELEFQLNTGEIFDYRYRRYDSEERHYLQYNEGLDNTLITTLGIKDPYKWAEDVLGYRLCNNGWPEAKSKEDLQKLIDYLCKFNNPKYIIKEDFILEDAYKAIDALIAEYIKQFQPKTTIKTNSYGDSKIKLRRKKADVRVGSCPAGSIVYGKRSKASVRSRRVSYQTCIGN